VKLQYGSSRVHVKSIISPQDGNQVLVVWVVWLGVPDWVTDELQVWLVQAQVHLITEHFQKITLSNRT